MERTFIDHTYEILKIAGAFSLGAIALFGPTLKSKFYRPKLEFTLKDKNPFVMDCTFDEQDTSSLKRILKINLLIKNVNKTSSERTQCICEKVLFERPDKTIDIFLEIAPKTFLWDNNKSSKTLIKGVPNYLEIAQIQKNESLTNEDETEGGESKNTSKDGLSLSISDPKTSGSYVDLGHGTFLIPVKLFSESQRKESLTIIRIFWNGDSMETKDNRNFNVQVFSGKELEKLFKDYKELNGFIL